MSRKTAKRIEEIQFEIDNRSASYFAEKYRLVPYPMRDFVQQAVKDVEQNFRGTMTEIKAEMERVKAEKDKEYRIMMNEYHAKRNEVENEFKQWLFEYNGVENNPKREKAYSYAYREGHSGGFNDIAAVFSDVVELIED